MGEVTAERSVRSHVEGNVRGLLRVGGHQGRGDTSASRRQSCQNKVASTGMLTPALRLRQTKSPLRCGRQHRTGGGGGPRAPRPSLPGPPALRRGPGPERAPRGAAVSGSGFARRKATFIACKGACADTGRRGDRAQCRPSTGRGQSEGSEPGLRGSSPGSVPTRGALALGLGAAMPWALGSPGC